MSKLYRVSIIDDTEEYFEVVVANTKHEAEEKAINMDCWGCLIYVEAEEIDIVNGYRIKLEKIEE